MKKYVKIECVIDPPEGYSAEEIDEELDAAIHNLFKAESLTIEVLDATQLVQAQD